MRVMTEDKAYQQYEEYAVTHTATKADPLRTFSGWIQQNSVKIVDENTADLNTQD